MISDLEQKLLARVDRDELVRLTRDLVRIDSVIRPETGATEREVVSHIAEWIRRELAMEPLIDEVEPGRQNIVVTLDSGVPGPCLMLEGHTDVVSEGSRERWTHDPFGGEVAGREDLWPGLLRYESGNRRCTGNRQGLPHGRGTLVREDPPGPGL